MRRFLFWLRYSPELDYIIVGIAIASLVELAIKGDVIGVVIEAIVIGIMRYTGHQRLRHIIASSVEVALEDKGGKA